jgi:hypothetical protein
MTSLLAGWLVFFHLQFTLLEEMLDSNPIAQFIGTVQTTPAPDVLSGEKQFWMDPVSQPAVDFNIVSGLIVVCDVRSVFAALCV